MSPAQELELYGPILEGLTLEEVDEAFQGLWRDRRLVEVMGDVDLVEGEPDPETAIFQVYQKAQQVAVSRWAQEESAVFPYLEVPQQAATIESHTPYSQIGVDRYLFSNGLIVNLKQTDYQPNEINVAVALGSGRRSEPVAGLGLLAERVIAESGLGGLTKEQLTAALAPYSSRGKFHVTEDSFRFYGKGLSAETELLFQLLATHIQDPAFRPGAYNRTMDRLVQMYSQLESSVEGMLQMRGERFLAGENSRYGLPELATLQEMTLEQVENWLDPVKINFP